MIFLSSFRVCSKKSEKRLFKRKKWPFLVYFWTIFGCSLWGPFQYETFRLWQTYGQCVFFWDIRTLKWTLKGPKMAIFESLLGACTPWHGQILAVLNDHSKVNSMDKDLSYGKHMVTMGWFQDICILKFGSFGPLMACPPLNYRHGMANSFFLTELLPWMYRARV